MNIRGLFQSIFGKRPTDGGGRNLPAFRLLSTWDSSFTPFSGNAWDIATVRAAVDAWARNAAKIQPRHIRRADGRREDVGDNLNRILQSKPNPYMTAYAFYYRVAAQFIVYNNAFILPVLTAGGSPHYTRSTPRESTSWSIWAICTPASRSPPGAFIPVRMSN